jgi:hypothetical protein
LNYVPFNPLSTFTPEKINPVPRDLFVLRI